MVCHKNTTTYVNQENNQFKKSHCTLVMAGVNTQLFCVTAVQQLWLIGQLLQIFKHQNYVFITKQHF